MQSTLWNGCVFMYDPIDSFLGIHLYGSISCLPLPFALLSLGGPAW